MRALRTVFRRDLLGSQLSALDKFSRRDFSHLKPIEISYPKEMTDKLTEPDPIPEVFRYDVADKWVPVHPHGAYVCVHHNGETWHLFNAAAINFGRMGTRVAELLMGKHKPTFKPTDPSGGDHVVIVNAASPKLTGNKRNQKKYYRHSTYPGGLKVTVMKDMLQKKPEYTIEHMMRGMLPRNANFRKYLTKLHVYPGLYHPHSSQGLPQFTPRPEVDHNKELGLDLNDPDLKILGPVDPEVIPEDFKHIPVVDKEYNYHLEEKKTKHRDYPKYIRKSSLFYKKMWKRYKVRQAEVFQSHVPSIRSRLVKR